MNHMIHKQVAVALLASCLSACARPAATEVTPVEGDVPINTTLVWPVIAGATAYDFYFGTTDPPPYQCRVAKPAFVLETLSPNTTYHWRAEPVGLPIAQRLSSITSFTTTAKVDRDATCYWPIKIANSVRAKFPTPEKLAGWNYTEGMIVDALIDIASRTGRDDDIVYARAWLDRFVRADGTIDPAQYPLELYSLDRIRPGPALLYMYGHTKEDKYLKAAEELVSQLDKQPRTTEGGYWHRSTYPNQMWLDGIYMADIFSAKYAAATGQPKYFDEAVKQITLIASHTHDPKTGLYYHGWDETKTRPWADKQTGASPEFWGRAIGWYAMAMADILDVLPADHPGRKQIMPIYQDLCKALVKYQDHDTGMWFQIIDKPTAPKNYVETSCSIMFACAFAKGANRGWLPPEFAEHARRATRGILNHKIDPLSNGTLSIRDTVGVGSLGPGGGTYDYYVNVPLVTDDQKAIGAFMYLTMALSDAPN